MEVFLTSPTVHACTIIVLIFAFLTFFERKNKIDKEKIKRNCKHAQCEKTGESVTFDTELNRTETVTLKCLNCEKIIQVKK